MPVIFFSKGNLAGEKMAGKLIAEHGFEKQEDTVISDGKKFETWQSGNLKLFQLETMHVFSDYLSEYTEFESDLVIFASTHKSGSQKPCFTAHPCGNWGAANQLGGRPHELAVSSARALKTAYSYLKEHELEGFPAYVEATHHGPTQLKSPVLFVEVGSNEQGWANEEAAGVAANAIMHTCQNYGKERGKIAIGFGGTHYGGHFIDYMDEGYAFSHLASKHFAGELDGKMALQALAKTAEKPEVFFMEKKNFKSSQRQMISDAVTNAGVEVELV